MPLLLLLVAGLLMGGAGVCSAQNTNSGDVRGIVTDTTGAVIPGATVTVKNIDKNVTTTYTTDGAGLYDTGSIVPDHYLITISRSGFKTYVRGPIAVDVAMITVNAQLTVGASSEQVVVTTQVPLLNTESGAVEDTLEAKTMDELPQQPGSPDWEQFVILQPGAANQPGAEGGDTGQSSAINGNMPYDDILADGATATLPQSQNANVSIFETVAEVKISNTAFSAQYGVGNIIYNQISKGGTDHFHGAGYDYLQNKMFNAASYNFDPNQKVTLPTIHFNDFGFAVGGPVKPLKKLFFYFDFDQTINNGGANNGLITVPTAAEQAGDFTAAGLPTLYDPTNQTLVTTGSCTYTGPQYPGGVLTTPAPCVERPTFISEYGSNKIPSSMINPASKALESYFPSPNSDGTIGKYGVTTNNYAYSAPNQSPNRRYFGRLDWDASQNNRVTISETEGDNTSNNLAQGFCPINCQHGDINYHNPQISDVWQITPTLSNEARLGFTWNLSAFTSYGNGDGWAGKLGMPMLVTDIFPTINLNNFYSLGAASNSVYDEMAFDPSDVVMLVKGRHVLHFGGEFLINRVDSTNWGYANPGTLGFNGEYTAAGGNATSSYDGLDYADFLLGQTNNWSASVSPEYGGRWKAPQLFAQDDWKVRPNLTVNLGVRYEIETGWSEVHGNETDWDPTVTNVDMIDPVGSGYGQTVQGGMWYGFLGQNGRHSLQKPTYNIVLPRVGFSWEVRNNTVLKGGFGSYASIWSEDRYGAGMGSAFGGSGSYGDVTNGRCPVVQADADGTSADTVDANCGVGAANNGASIMSTYEQSPTTAWAHEGVNQSVNYNEYHTPVPMNYQWNLGVQHQFARDYAAELDYVGNHGANLTYNVDINQVPESKLGPNDQPDTPYPLYKDINGSTNNAVSNYNALEAILNKRMSYGLSFNVNYTWSHFLDDMDSSGWGGQNGNMDYQNAYSPASNYSRSNWDIRNMLKGQAIYQLPFGKGGLFLNHGTLADEVVGGWRASATYVAQSGNPIPLASALNQANALGGTVFPNLTGNWKSNDTVTGNNYHSLAEWFNESAFSEPAQYTFGNFVRNQISGPGMTDLNFALGKTFDLWPEQGVKFELRAEAYNVLNHPSWGLPGNIGSGDALMGAPLSSPTHGPESNIPITSTTVGGRSMQFYGRLSF